MNLVKRKKISKIVGFIVAGLLLPTYGSFMISIFYDYQAILTSTTTTASMKYSGIGFNWIFGLFLTVVYAYFIFAAMGITDEILKKKDEEE